MTNVVFGENIEQIDEEAFESNNLKGISFKKCKKLEIIASKAFYNNSGNFSTLTLPRTIQTIGSLAFNTQYSGVMNIYCDAVIPPDIERNTFGYNGGYNSSRRLKVYVVSGSEEAYKAANYWKDAVSIEAYK